MMKQVIQNYRTGDLKIEEVPVPLVRPSAVLVRTLFSAISAGTERTKVETAKMNLVQKARSRPDLVKKVIQKVRKEGLSATVQMVNQRLNDPVPLGYSSVGVVEEIGEWVDGVMPGDIVACAGAGYANHSEYNVVPGRLIARVPDGVKLEQASFATIASIALQGVRQAEPKLGEKVVVIGMGLLGQIAGALLRANGCQVFGIDLDSWKLELAKSSGGADETGIGSDAQLHERVKAWTRGRGADAVLLTASTPSDGPIEQAGLLCRDKGRVVIVGAVGTRFPREPYYMKEIDIRIARSYGPGRYDPMYEELGIDYPVGFVRFTEQRNMEAVLDLLATRRLDLSALITHRYRFEQADQAFGLLADSAKTYLGIVLEYGATVPTTPLATGAAAAAREAAAGTSASPSSKAVASVPDPLCVGFVGLGNYATAQLVPAISKVSGARLMAVASGSGISARVKGGRVGFRHVMQSPGEVIASPSVGTVFIATRHDTHARFVREALQAGKNVFVEKPLCLHAGEVQEIREDYESSKGVLCVGFNRRFAPLVQELKGLFSEGCEHLVYRVNAGPLPAEHWLKIPESGGGRLIGEACHFIDLAADLASSPIRAVHAIALGTQGARKTTPVSAEDFHITLQHANGSLSTIVYLSSGDTRFPKEYIEVHGNGVSAALDDFKTLTVGGRKPKRLPAQDKGQRQMVKAFLNACASRRRSAPIPISAIWNSTQAVFAAIESLKTGQMVKLDAASESEPKSTHH